MAGSTPLWRTHTTVLLVAGFFVVLIALVVSFMITSFRPTVEARAESGVYSLWLANTEAARIQGLSGVESLQPNGGLLMHFPEDGLHAIWMKDMKIPLDIIWLDSNKQVVYMVTNAAPELSTTKTFVPTNPARYVLEVSAGSAGDAGIRIGSKFDFTVEDTAL